jgi:hypothetical protein
MGKRNVTIELTNTKFWPRCNSLPFDLSIDSFFQATFALYGMNIFCPNEKVAIVGILA